MISPLAARNKRCRRVALIAISLAIFTVTEGCSTTSRNLTDAAPAFLLTNADFLKQGVDDCGPTSLYIALDARGAKPALERLTEQVYLPKRGGSLPTEMQAAARQYGFAAYRLAPTLAALHTELNANRPVVVFYNAGFSALPSWHFAVVAGYQPDSRTLYLHNGVDAFKPYAFDRFYRRWREGKFWAISLLKPGELPGDAPDDVPDGLPTDITTASGREQTASWSAADETSAPTAKRFIEALVDMENHWSASERLKSLRPAAARWPQNTAIQLNLGIAEYQQAMKKPADPTFNIKQLLASREALRRAVDAAPVASPLFAVATNNLAVVETALGCRRQALQRLQLALNVPGDSESSATTSALLSATLQEWLASNSPANEPKHCR